MRIIHYYARYRSHISGVTDSINNWAEQAERFGHEVHIWSARTSTAGTNNYIDESVSGTIPHFGTNRTNWIPLGLISRLKRGDWLYLHEGWTISNLTAAIIGRFKRCVVVTMPHGVYEPGIALAMADRWGLRARLERLTLRLSHVIHVFYAGEVDIVNSFARRTSQFITVPNGGPDPSRQPPWRGTGDFFVWIGRFDVEHKGLDNLLRFWANLPSPRPRLVMAGPDHLGGKTVVVELIRTLGLVGEVEVRGRVSGADKQALLTESRGYLHPSRWESCSITLLEFLSAGTPCLASDSIHATNALAPSEVLIAADFESGRPEAARTVLAELDKNSALGTRARNWATESGSWPAVGRKYASLLDKTAKALAS